MRPSLKKSLPIYPLTLVIAVVVSILYVSPLLASTTDEAVNKAGKQRMITQRIMKDYALVGMNIEVGDPATDLSNLITEFDSNLKTLKEVSGNKVFSDSLVQVEKLWIPIKATLKISPNEKAAPKLQKDLDALLDACNKSTNLIAGNASNEKLNIINLSGKQRMLSQRMAALYMLKAWKVDDGNFQKKLHSAMDEFSAAHKTLVSSSFSNTEIKTLLKKVKKAYMWFEMMGKSKSNRVIPALINRSANSILADMDKVTNLYTSSKSN